MSDQVLTLLVVIGGLMAWALGVAVILSIALLHDAALDLLERRRDRRARIALHEARYRARLTGREVRA